MANFEEESINLSELNDLLEILTKERSRYNTFQLLDHVIEKCMDENKFLEEISNNIPNNNIELEDIFCYDKDEYNFLGLKENNLVQTVMKHFVMHCRKTLIEFENLIGDSVSTIVSKQKYKKLNLSEDDELFIKQKCELENNQKTCVENLKSIINILETIHSMKISELPQVYKIQAHIDKLQCKLLQLRTEYMEQVIIYDIFQETPCTISAFQDVLNHINKLKQNFDNKIIELKEKN